jgi:hypothetical protein
MMQPGKVSDTSPEYAAVETSLRDLVTTARRIEGLEDLPAPVGLHEGPPEATAGAETQI